MSEPLLTRLKTLSINSFAEWKNLAEELKKAEADKEAVTYCLARAYTQEDGFYEYCRDVLGYRDLYGPFHRPMCEQLMDTTHKYKLVQACRGSFKSSVGTIGKASWKIAKETIETGECNIRILIASEVLELARQFCKTIRQTIESPTWVALYGDHKGKDRRVGWGVYEFTSCFRQLARTKEPTVSPMSLEAPRTGFHYDLIIADDLEVERTSASRDQIERCWDFYRLIHSLLEPTTGELILISTRWHYDDIYSRIIERNKDEDPEERFSISIQPARLPDGTLTFPTRFSEEVLAGLMKKQGSYIFSCQYLLDPVPPEDRIFKQEWIKYVTVADLEQRRREGRKYRIYTGADFAYTLAAVAGPVRIGGGRLPDWTVIFTAAVDDRWNYFLIDWFRKRCTKLEAVSELFRQFHTHKSLVCGLEKRDKMLIEDTIIQYAHTTRLYAPRREWITYPSKVSKFDRIETVLQPVFEAHKMYLLPDMKWLEQEMLDFPRGAYDDGLDAMVNLVHVSKPAGKKIERTKMNDIQKRIAYLKRGVVYDDVGGPKTWKNF